MHEFSQSKRRPQQFESADFLELNMTACVEHSSITGIVSGMLTFFCQRTELLKDPLSHFRGRGFHSKTENAAALPSGPSVLEQPTTPPFPIT